MPRKLGVQALQGWALVVQTLVGRNAGNVVPMVVQLVEALQTDMVVEGTVDKVPKVVAYSHMVDKAAGDIVHVEVAWIDKGNAALVAASLDQTCSHLPEME